MIHTSSSVNGIFFLIIASKLAKPASRKIVSGYSETLRGSPYITILGCDCCPRWIIPMHRNESSKYYLFDIKNSNYNYRALSGAHGAATRYVVTDTFLYHVIGKVDSLKDVVSDIFIEFFWQKIPDADVAKRERAILEALQSFYRGRHHLSFGRSQQWSRCKTFICIWNKFLVHQYKTCARGKLAATGNLKAERKARLA